MSMQQKTYPAAYFEFLLRKEKTFKDLGETYGITFEPGNGYIFHRPWTLRGGNPPQILFHLPTESEQQRIAEIGGTIR